MELIFPYIKKVFYNERHKHIMKTLGNNTQNNIINNIKEYTIKDKVNENDKINVSLKKY